MAEFGEDFFDDPFADDGHASIDDSFHGLGSQDGSGIASEIEPTPSSAESASSSSVSSAAPAATDQPAVTGQPAANGDGAQTANGPVAQGTGNLERMMESVLTAMLGTQEMFKAAMENRQTRSRKVYVPMPEKFDGRVGDYIDNWIDQFQTWFNHRERSEQVAVDDRERIEIAIQDCNTEVSLALRNHETRVARWTTWDSFARHMRTYASQESGF